MEQQAQTRNYFQANAGDWQRRSIGAAGRYSVIEGRSRAVLAVTGHDGAGRRFLDVGCGTGQLVLETAKRGFEAEGIDFAEEMVSKCEENMRAAGAQAHFLCNSFFDVPYGSEAYDIISAQGFIEYLSPDETMEFFRRSHRMLRQGGALVVGSRNRIFNIVSLNEFTQMEVRLGTVELLLSEAVALNTERFPGGGLRIVAAARTDRSSTGSASAHRNPGECATSVFSGGSRLPAQKPGVHPEDGVPRPFSRAVAGGEIGSPGVSRPVGACRRGNRNRRSAPGAVLFDVRDRGA